MCFGQSQVDQKTTNSTANPAVSSAATQNLDYVSGLQKAGFTPYSGPQVASFSPQQQSSFDMTNSIANNGTAPAATSLINSYASAPAQSVSANPISANMSPYMNQYVMQALAPQMTQMDIQNAKTNANTNAQATGSGAFGDARTGIEQANNNFLQGVQREGVIGNAYNQAFNTAISAGAQDSSNQLSASNANAGYAETALGRALGGANALEGLQNQQLGVANAQNQMGQQQTAQSQAGLTAAYNQWLMAQQYPFQTAQLMNQTTAAGAQAMPASTTTTEMKPDNSGWALAGALGGVALAPFTGGASLGLTAASLGGMGGGGGDPGTSIGGSVGPSSYGGSSGPMPLVSDRDLKKDIVEVGKLLDGTPVYSYSYFDEDTPRIGLMAQDVEKRVPGAVHELWPGGAKAVDYGAATALSRALAMAA